MNQTIAKDIKNAFTNAIRQAFPTLPDIQVSTSIANPKFGDYQCNAAMSIYKMHKEALEGLQSPKDVADKIQENLTKNIFEEVIVAKQGFITVRVSRDYLKHYLFLEMDGVLEAAKNKSRHCLVDYSSPNIAKEMHVGHLRSTIIGETLCRVLEFAGHTVLRVNHLGDWGTQFGMLIEYLKEEYPDFQTNRPRLEDLTTFYRSAKERFDTDPNFKRRAQLNVPLLQGGDEFCLAAWKLCCDISRIDFQKVYDRLKVNLIERGESFYNPMIADVVKEVQERGLITESDGAKCLFVENDDVPLILVKSDGGYGYDTTDMAAIKHRLIIEKNDWVFYVTDMGQEVHFQKLFKAAKAMGWHCPPNTRCQHVGFGLVQGEDGKKFKTRSGDLVKLTELLDEAVDRAMTEISQRQAEETIGEEHSESHIPARDAAEAIGYSAVRYFDLKQNRMTNYRFSYDKMLDPKGNTAVYMLYAYARICAIFRKANVEPSSLDRNCLNLSTPQEIALALQMIKFYDVIDTVLEDMFLHRIAEYMYDLSGAFTTFYQTCKVIGDSMQTSRLLLCHLTRQFLAKSFYLLGITPLTRI